MSYVRHVELQMLRWRNKVTSTYYSSFSSSADDNDFNSYDTDGKKYVEIVRNIACKIFPFGRFPA